MDLQTFIRDHEITSTELADGIGLKRSTVSNKLLGIRPWFQEEVDQVLAFLSRRLDRPVTYEEAFNGKAA